MLSYFSGVSQNKGSFGSLKPFRELGELTLSPSERGSSWARWGQGISTLPLSLLGVVHTSSLGKRKADPRGCWHGWAGSAGGRGWQQDLSLAGPFCPTVRAQAPGADLRHGGSWALALPYIAVDPKSSSSASPRVTWKGWSK